MKNALIMYNGNHKEVYYSFYFYFSNKHNCRCNFVVHSSWSAKMLFKLNVLSCKRKKKLSWLIVELMRKSYNLTKCSFFKFLFVQAEHLCCTWKNYWEPLTYASEILRGTQVQEKMAGTTSTPEPQNRNLDIQVLTPQP